ncbi:MAG TPA: PD-(D/E)XK nuclease family protein [Leptospiraceae bacterium]|nr:PD-(D/E)XK nuclease family protein [Leptospiraceae bacterium]HNN06966.1 PD-(D/E)XK nuclease family protein [Leptospiraceae bacterium]
MAIDKRLKNVPEEIKRSFDANFALLRAESGHSISGELRDMAYKTILGYWFKGQDIIKAIKRTEEKLTLPEQISPWKDPQGKKRRVYTLEGVVDVVTLNKKVILYDIKTYDYEIIKDKKHTHEIQKQLNVYVHIWEKLNVNDPKFKEVAGIGVIVLSYPKELKKDIREKKNLNVNEKNFLSELENIINDYSKKNLDWKMEENFSLNRSDIKRIIEEFGHTIDAIVDRKFSPRPYSKKTREGEETGILQILFPKEDKKTNKVNGEKFATRVCRNCDARFSCNSYRQYMKNQAVTGKRTFGSENRFAKYIDLSSNDNVSPDETELDMDKEIEDGLDNSVESAILGNDLAMGEMDSNEFSTRNSKMSPKAKKKNSRKKYK